MRKLLFCTVFILFAVSRLAAQNTDTAAVKQVFQSYMELADANDGEALSELISQSTIDHYKGVLKHVRFSKKKKLQRLGIMEKMTILITRHMVDRKKARQLGKDGKRYFEYLVDNGMVRSDKDLSFGRIKFEGSIAKCQVIYGGKPIPEDQMAINFAWEQDQWKIDITSIINNPLIQSALQETLKEVEMTEEEFILSAIKMKYGEDVNKEEIWKPTK